MTNRNIDIVYFIWININRNWKVIIEGQLFDLDISKILENSYLHIVVSCQYTHLEDEIKNIIKNNLKDYVIYDIEFHKDNHYEYQGIKKLYDLSQIHHDRFFLYIHSKGMFHWYDNNPNKRWEDEVSLSKNTIYMWKDILNVFELNPHFMKIGLLPSSHDDFIWFNFFWVRGSYLKTCECPIITDNRYYYESWLSTSNQIWDNNSSYSLYSSDCKKYSADEAIKIIEQLRGKF
jgi:hypothetical protein